MTRGTCKTIAEIFALLVKIFVIAALVVAVIGLSQARTEAQERAEEHKREISEHKANEERLTNEVVTLTEKAANKETELSRVNDLVTSLQDEIEDLKAINKEQAATIKDQEQALAVLKEQNPNEYAGVKMNAEERELLEWVVALEAGDQPDVGQKGVVETIFNRYLSDEWQDTINDVLTAKGQFDAINYLDKPDMTPADRERKNIDFVLKNGRTVLPEGYVYFATYKANGTGFIQIADHYFSR